MNNNQTVYVAEVDGNPGVFGLLRFYTFTFLRDPGVFPAKSDLLSDHRHNSLC